MDKVHVSCSACGVEFPKWYRWAKGLSRALARCGWRLLRKDTDQFICGACLLGRAR